MSQTTYIGFSPHKKQLEIIHGILEGKAKYNVISTGRQMGKTLMSMNLLLYWALNNGPARLMWVSPVYSQANKVMKELMAAIGSSGVVESANLSANEIKLKNGSTIIFRSAERYDNIRGETLDYCVIDEAAFIKDEAWAEAIKPTLLVRGKKCIIVSTPKGKNWFYELYQLGVSADYNEYKSFKGSSYDTPFISKREIEEAKRTIPENIFKQEYLAEFLDSGGEVFTNLDRHSFIKYPQKHTAPYFGGVDWGMHEDFTVLTILDKDGQVVDFYRANNKPWSEIVQDLAQRAKQWNASILVETNSIGDPMFERLKDQWANTHPFTTTNKSKQEIIEGLILDFNEDRVHIPHQTLEPSLWNELSVFTYEYSPKTRSVRYGHPSGLHDDTVISLAIANYWRKQNKSYGTYNIYRR